MSERNVEIPFLYANVRNNSLVLDIGMDRVGYTDYLIGMGCIVESCDPRRGDATYPIKFQDMSEDKKYDVIVFLSTLEHFDPSPENFITHQTEINAILKARRMLKSDGIIIITVPFGKGMILNDDAIQWDNLILNTVIVKTDVTVIDRCLFKCSIDENFNDVWKLSTWHEVENAEFFFERGHAGAVYMGIWQ